MTIYEEMILWATRQELLHPEWAEAMTSLRLECAEKNKSQILSNDSGLLKYPYSINYANNAYHHPRMQGMETESLLDVLGL